jgi:amino-acid N-acetyltransferase
MNSNQQPIRQQPSRAAAVALLERMNLPVADITDQHLRRFFYTGAADAPTGMVGIEVYGAVALLRSLVVSEDARSAGLGTALIAHVEDHAGSHGVDSLYLLTTTAEAFFAHRGYTRIDRAVAPAAIQSTREYAGLCPSSAAFMFKRLSITTGDP